MNGDAREKRARERKDPKIESRSEGNESQAEEGQERLNHAFPRGDGVSAENDLCSDPHDDLTMDHFSTGGIQ
ncbi:hypothetical protein BofuT4_uP150100.1 [Botrytis cinerea T4]|uniref:Uncharacterized protein n=1 Tax=Botryotinia fuckeliana (strain T4) TaxID=999810 RepID=G2YW80_BOTF4|nr:hypothetical protein BofuT4_uP150100.1 [Botrytis cinerea T4]